MATCVGIDLRSRSSAPPARGRAPDPGWLQRAADKRYITGVETHPHVNEREQRGVGKGNMTVVHEGRETNKVAR